MVSFQSNAPLPSSGYAVATGTDLSDPFITVFATRVPNANDFNYPVKKRWINLTPGSVSEWVLTGFTNVSGQSLAIWVEISSTVTAALIAGQLNEQATAVPSPFPTVIFNSMTNTNFVNPMSSARWIVDPLSTTAAPNGTHTNITAAIASAVAGDTIFIMPGIYTESFTMKGGVNLAANSSDGFGNGVVVNGTMTLTNTGTNAFSGIIFQTNSANAITMSGTNAITANFVNCKINASTGTGVANSNPNAVAKLISCIYSVSGASPFLAASGGSNITLSNCFGFNNSNAASTNASSTIIIYNSYIEGAYTTSGTGVYDIANTLMSSGGINLTTVGTGSSTIYNSALSSAGGSCLSIGVGSTVTITSATINTSTNPALTGAGTINYGGLVFVSGAVNNVTTKNLLTVT